MLSFLEARRRRISGTSLLLTIMLGLTVIATMAGAAADSPFKDDSAAHKLYVAKCAKCHKFYDPAKYSDQQWKGWMTKMSKKARLKPDQQEQLARYIEETLRHPAKPAERRAPALRDQSSPTLH